MKKQGPTLLFAALYLASSLSTAAGPQWTWEAGKQSTGAITLKSADGSTTYSGTQNPTGGVAKTNQSAATQPPTVIIQATGGSGGNAIDDAETYIKTNCWTMVIHATQPAYWDGYAYQPAGNPSTGFFIGRGKLTGLSFTGAMGFQAINQYSYIYAAYPSTLLTDYFMGGQFVLYNVLASGPDTPFIVQATNNAYITTAVGQTAAGINSYPQVVGNRNSVFLVKALPLVAATPCIYY